MERLQAFPAERVVDFLMTEQHLYRVAYMREDLKTRFISDLLVNPELIQVESDLAKEKVEEANYSLARVFPILLKNLSTAVALLTIPGNEYLTF